jgi:hypothetical protein
MMIGWSFLTAVRSQVAFGTEKIVGTNGAGAGFSKTFGVQTL